MKHKNLKKFCKKGHNTFVCGRKKNGECKQCHRGDVKQLRDEIKQGKRTSKIRKRFCVHGHDTFIVGRDVHQTCNECKKQMDKKYSRTEKGIKVKRKGRLKYARSRHGKKAVREYQRSPRGKVAHAIATIKCRTNRGLRVIPWTDWDRIKEFELNKPKGMTTDHFIPLNNKKVWGLHVSWNLQYLTPSENSIKHNHVDLLEASKWYGKILKKAGLK